METKTFHIQKNLQPDGFPKMDLFASRVSHQIPQFMSWKPDQFSSATDALSQDWGSLFPYAFPPFCLIGRALRKMLKHRISMIIVTPVWTSQPWYPLLLDLSIQNRILLPQEQNLLLNPRMKIHPLLENRTLRLAASLVSGNHQQQTKFRQQLPLLSQIPDKRVSKKLQISLGKVFWLV